MQSVTTEKIREFERLTASAEKISVVVHTRPDGDAIGSGLALCSFLREKRGKDCVLILPDAAPQTLSFLTGQAPVLDASADADAALRRLAESGLVLVLDLCRLDRAAGLEGALRACSAPRILIDHHPDPEKEAFALLFSETRCSSTCELLFWILTGLHDIGGKAERLPGDCRRALMTGLTTDTNNFANSVFPTTLQMASALLESGTDRDEVLEHLYHEDREERVKAFAFLLSERLFITPDGVAGIVLDAATREALDLRDGETEGLVNIPLQIDRVKISVFAREEEGQMRVSIRSKRGWSANRLATAWFHGGGHEQASGGRLRFPDDIASAAEAEDYIRKVTAGFLHGSGTGHE